MEASELRIGNWYNGGVEGCEIKGSLNAKIRAEENYDFILTEDTFKALIVFDLCKIIQGIPLTEEWLFNFGFEKGYIDVWVKRTESNTNWGQLTFEFFDGILFFTGGEGWEMSKPFNFVHEIQGFWYGLTGEELTIKTNLNEKRN